VWLVGNTFTANTALASLQGAIALHRYITGLNHSQ
jgi:hypothetical protein